MYFVYKFLLGSTCPVIRISNLNMDTRPVPPYRPNLYMSPSPILTGSHLNCIACAVPILVHI